MNLDDCTTLLTEFGWRNTSDLDQRRFETQVGSVRVTATANDTHLLLRAMGPLPAKFVGFRPNPADGRHMFVMRSTPAGALAEILGRIGAYKGVNGDTDAVIGQAWVAQARDGNRWDETMVAMVAVQMDREALTGAGWAESVPA